MKNQNNNPSASASNRALKLIQLGLCMEELFEDNDPVDICKSLSESMALLANQDSYDFTGNEQMAIHQVMKAVLNMVTFKHDYDNGSMQLQHLNHIVFEDQEEDFDSLIEEGAIAFKKIMSSKIGNA